MEELRICNIFCSCTHRKFGGIHNFLDMKPLFYCLAIFPWPTWLLLYILRHHRWSIWVIFLGSSDIIGSGTDCLINLEPFSCRGFHRLGVRHFIRCSMGWYIYYSWEKCVQRLYKPKTLCTSLFCGLFQSCIFACSWHSLWGASCLQMA